MLVKDVIARLSKFDDNLDVVVTGSDTSEIAYFVLGVKLDKIRKVSTYDNNENMVVIFGDK